MKNPKKYIFWISLIIIISFSAILRLYKLQTYPILFNQDAAVMGYDAWSIWKTAHDHHGQFLPLFFKTFYDYVPPVPNYIIAPFVGLLGLSEWSTRLPIALSGIITVFIVALIGRQWFNSKVGLIAALLLTIDPWHVNYSRIAHPGSFIPFFIVLSLYFFTRGMIEINKQTEQQVNRLRVLGWFAASGISFALLTATYPALKIQGPLLLGACLIASIPSLWRNRSRLTLSCIIWLLLVYSFIITPLAIEQIRDWSNIQGRYEAMSIFHQNPWLPLFFEHYSRHYNPSNLFFTGFLGGLSIHPQAIGELFWLEWPLWIFAIIGLWQAKYTSRKTGLNIPILIAFWFITFPIASSLTTWDIPHEIRSYCFIPLAELLAGYGALIAWQEISRVRIKWLHPKIPALTITAISVLILSIFTHRFISGYFTPLPNSTDQFPYNTGLQPVLTQIIPKTNKCDTIWIDDTNQPYIYYLFYTLYDPHKIQPIAKQINKTKSGFNKIEQVHFGNPDTASNKCEKQTSRIYWITRTQTFGTEWEKISSSKAKNGISLWNGLLYKPAYN